MTIVPLCIGAGRQPSQLGGGERARRSAGRSCAAPLGAHLRQGAGDPLRRRRGRFLRGGGGSAAVCRRRRRQSARALAVKIHPGVTKVVVRSPVLSSGGANSDDDDDGAAAFEFNRWRFHLLPCTRHSMVTATYAEGRGRARRHRPQGRQPRRRRQRWSRCPGLHYHLKHLHFRELGKIMLPSSVMICLGSLTWNACLCVFSQAVMKTREGHQLFSMKMHQSSDRLLQQFTVLWGASTQQMFHPCSSVSTLICTEGFQLMICSPQGFFRY